MLGREKETKNSENKRISMLIYIPFTQTGKEHGLISEKIINSDMQYQINYTLKIKIKLKSNETLSNKNLTKNQKFFLEPQEDINQLIFLVKSIVKMKAKHRSRINDHIDEISDSISKPWLT